MGAVQVRMGGERRALRALTSCPQTPTLCSYLCRSHAEHWMRSRGPSHPAAAGPTLRQQRRDRAQALQLMPTLLGRPPLYERGGLRRRSQAMPAAGADTVGAPATV